MNTFHTQVQEWASKLGFSHIAFTAVHDARFLASAQGMSQGLSQWLAAGYHGEMTYMQQHGSKRTHPQELVPGTNYLISLRMNYVPATRSENWMEDEQRALGNPQQGLVSLYARGRDYHKVLRKRLQKLAETMTQYLSELGYSECHYRCFTDSAPVMEVALAEHSGLGWRGKHTLLLSRQGGSFFFLGEIFLTLPNGLDIPQSMPTTAHCGQCSACIDVCPTRAIVAPYQLDARRCISYLTIEHKGAIPLELRSLMGNRIYGCDDCQLVCPWNKYAQTSPLPDFAWRDAFVHTSLLEYLSWSEEVFLRLTEGSPIRRIGHERWQRNVAVALGNALAALGDSEQEGVFRQQALQALEYAMGKATPLVQEHLSWALQQVL